MGRTEHEPHEPNSLWRRWTQPLSLCYTLFMVQRHETRTIDLSDVRNCLVAVLSDTHGNPHRNLFPILTEYRPSLILHAGDLGDVSLLAELEKQCQTIFVRGNIDPASPRWPESVALRLKLGNATHLDLMLLHIAIVHLKLNKRALNLLRQHPAQVVVFGHSHIPYIGREGETWLFNPGSAGPARFGLPTTLGFMEISSERLRFKHLDLKTGQPWTPK